MMCVQAAEVQAGANQYTPIGQVSSQVPYDPDPSARPSVKCQAPTKPSDVNAARTAQMTGGYAPILLDNNSTLGEMRGEYAPAGSAVP